jgi:hypothetical protein
LWRRYQPFFPIALGGMAAVVVFRMPRTTIRGLQARNVVLSSIRAKEQRHDREDNTHFIFD